MKFLCLLAFCVVASSMPAWTALRAQAAGTMDATLINGYRPAWWKEAVVYQVYPRSFKDSNGDGIGDLPGITSKLDYIAGLGVNVIWLSPHYDSPNADNGYDIRDYRKVMAEFGTMADFEAMLAGIKQRKMKLIIDLVVNHTSDEHRWFVESRKSKDNPYRDYYIWRPAKNGVEGQQPNNYPSFFSGPAWKYDAATKEYYLHYFAEKQPDLNWNNPKVREEVYSMMRFWLDKGVDGFRMDVIPLISKRDGLTDLTPAELSNFGNAYANGPHMHEYLQEMNRQVMARYDVMTVGEALGISLEQTPQIAGEDRHELNLIFNFDAIRYNRDGLALKPPDLPAFKAIYTNHARTLDTRSWDTVFLSNHDNPRIVSTFGDDSPEFRVASAKLLETLLLTQRGTPFLYQGDELGMTNYPFQKIDQMDDIEARNAYKARVLTGQMSDATYMADMRQTSRDNSRTPMQWDSSSFGGFTAGTKPWLGVNPNYAQINAANELSDPGSVYNYTAKAIKLRHDTPALIYGDYKDIDPANTSIFAYTRVLADDKYLVVMNFSRMETGYALPNGIKAGKLVLGNLKVSEEETSTLHLKAWEARIYRY